MSQTLVIKEPVFIEHEGKRIAVILPIELYEAMRPHQTETLQSLNVKRELDLVEIKEEDKPSFERERAVFARLKPELLRKYTDQCVAIVGGAVVETGDDELELYNRVRARFGNVSMFIQRVSEKPHVHHISGPRLVR